LPTIRDVEPATSSLRTLPNEALQALFDSLSDLAVCMLTPEGYLSSWNAGATTVTGYTIAEALGLHFSKFFPKHSSEHATTNQLLQEAIRIGRAEVEAWQIRKDGARFWASVLIQPIRSEGKDLTGFAYVARDITTQHVTQAALLESERRFRLLVEGVTDYAIYMLDPSGIVSNWNAGAERLKGYVAEEIVGQHFSKFYTSRDRLMGLPAQVLNIAATTGRYEGEGWRVRKDGSQFWASVVVDAIRDSKGTLIGFGKVTRDISERRVAQEALKQSEQHLRHLIDGVQDYALIMLDPNGIISSWNLGAQRIKGYLSEDVIGTHFSRFYMEDDRAAGVPAKGLATAESEGRFEAEGWRVRKDGSTFWANVVITCIRDANGKVLGYAKVTRDITERRSAQLNLQEAQARASQAQKMEALGHLTGGVAHDFNNLLMIVSGQSHVLKRAAQDNEKAVNAAEAIESAIARGASLTRQLLTFSRRQTLSPKAIDVSEQLAAFKSMLMGTMSGLTILTSIPPGTWPIIADPNELELSLLNLAINARDAMSNGGSITITAENTTLSRNAGTDLEGEFVAITVADTGAGIAPDVLPKIFDPFFTTKQAHNGSGLGLSQVHGFTHQSGGRVAIDSELGHGTRITLYLPRATTKPDALQNDNDAETAGHGMVFVIDDNPDVSAATCAILRELGYEVATAGDVPTALELISERMPTLVLTDIVMPGEKDGIALARELRQAHPDLPIVLMTGYSKNMPADQEFPLIRKPCSLTEMGRIVRSAIAAKSAPPSNLIHFKAPSSGKSSPE
jgi:PAS domain S-box-containing protein